MNRWKILDQCLSILEDKKRLKILWPRASGKTTKLQTLYDIISKKYHCIVVNFDEHIISRQFTSKDEFLFYLHHEYGLEKENESYVFLNEIQYSKDIESFIIEIISQDNYPIHFISTWVHSEEHSEDNNFTWTLELYPFSFQEFAEYHKLPFIHSDYKTFWKQSYEHYKEYIQEFISSWGYPSVVTAKWHRDKLYQVELILKKIFDKDVGLEFSRTKVILFQEFLKGIAKSYEISLSTIKLWKQLWVGTKHLHQFLEYAEKHYLIFCIQSFSSDKTRELSLKKKYIISDNSIISYYNARMHSTNFQMNKEMITWFLIQELIKNGWRKDQLFYYEKVNGTTIDCIIKTDAWKYIPISILDHLNPSKSKALYHFIKQYHNTIEYAIQLCPYHLAETNQEWILIKNVPYTHCHLISPSLWL